MTIERKESFPPALVAAVVALLSVAVYSVTLGGTYVYDDVPVVQHDRRLHPEVYWKYLWIGGYNGGVDRLYRPLVSTSYGLQWWLHGDRPWAFHLVNILLHAACSVFVAELTRRMLGSRVGLAAGLLFAAHPIHVEAAANIVGRAELLCGLGMFAALTLALKPITVLRALAIGGCFVVAVLSKEQGMLLPLIILILLVCRNRNDSPITIGTRSGLLFLASLLLWLLAGYLIWREQLFRIWWDRSDLDWTINPLVRSAGLDRWLVPLEILGRYVALFFAPVALSPDYSAKVIEPFVHYQQPYFAIGIVSLVAWCVLLVAAVKKRRQVVIFLLIALALTYGLVGNIVMLIGTSMGERLMYTPSALLTILFACGLSAVVPKRIPFAVTLILLVGLCSLRSVSYAVRWNDPVNLFEAALHDQPASVHLHMLLADAYLKRGQLDKADEINARAQALMSDYWDLWLQSGQIAAEKSDFDRAEACFNKSLDLRRNPYASRWLSELPQRRAAATQKAATSAP